MDRLSIRRAHGLKVALNIVIVLDYVSRVIADPRNPPIVVEQSYRPPARGHYFLEVAITLSRQMHLVAVFIKDSHQGSLLRAFGTVRLGRKIGGSILKRKIPSISVPVDAGSGKNGDEAGIFIDGVGKAGAGRDSPVVDRFSVR